MAQGHSVLVSFEGVFGLNGYDTWQVRNRTAIIENCNTFVLMKPRALIHTSF